MSGMDELKDWVTLLIVIAIASLAMQTLTSFIQRFLKLDRTEREQVLQGQIDSLIESQEKYEAESESEISGLRNHIKLLIKQYDELVIEHNELKLDYQKSQVEIVTLKEQVSLLTQQSVLASASAVSSQRTLVVCTAPDNVEFGLDIASLRAVRTDTGMEVSQVKEPSPDNLKRMLDRLRARGGPFYLHLAIRSNKDGYQIGDKIVDATWLSSILDGVIVLLVAGSDSDAVGDFLGVVPYVITISGGVTHRDIALFSRLFWIEIGRGIGPSLALKRARDHSPSTIRESIVSHWMEN